MVLTGISNDEALSLARQERALRAEQARLEEEVGARRERLETLQELIDVAASVDEVYKGVALTVSSGGLIECVARDHTTRYADVRPNYKVTSEGADLYGLEYGDDSFGRRERHSYGCWYPRSIVELAAREWVVCGVVPDLDDARGA